MINNWIVPRNNPYIGFLSGYAISSIPFRLKFFIPLFFYPGDLFLLLLYLTVYCGEPCNIVQMNN